MPNEIDACALSGQVAMVTGAGLRIGREIALTLGRAGANVVVHYNHSRGEAQATAREIRNYGAQAVALRADVTSPTQIQRMFQAAEKRFGQLDMLVNNAAIFFPVTWDQLNEKQWDRILAVNLKGPFFCAQAAAKMMRKRKGGQIINISSLGGLNAWPDYMHYCSSKAGLIMLTRCLAKALAPDIRVNSIAPGTIMFPDEKRSGMMENVIQTTPLKKAGRGEDIAQMVLYLACHGEFITGQVFPVDGGKSIP